MKKFLADGSRKGEQKKPDPEQDDAEGEGDTFPHETSCLMIFGGLESYASKRRQKLERREVYEAKPATPTFLKWSRSAITFDHFDHSESILRPSWYPLLVNPIVDTKCLTKVLMDGGSSLNIMYAETLDAMGISRSRIRSTRGPFHDVVPGKLATPLGQIDLPITFGTPSNYRTETLTFEVVEFHGAYHAILGHPCYVKFMAVPNYTYLKLKMSGPNGIITVGTSVQRAYECDMECCELALTIIASEELSASPH
jgi:hypothetical protein